MLRQEVIISRLERAETFSLRLVGLLGREALPEDSGLLIAPCNQVHTFFMKFSIDVIFLDRNGKVLRVYSELHPWRMTSLVWRAKSVLELAQGRASSIAIGDYLLISGRSVFKSNAYVRKSL